MDVALERLCREADDALAVGINILILSDRAVGAERAPLPSLLAVAAVHHHLVREGTRLQAGLVVESGEARSVHSVATLIGYGAAAVNPYLMLETLGELVELGWLPDGMSVEQAQRRAVKGIGKGLLKTMSKMGISTIPSYCGAQIFEAVGLVARARRTPLHRHRVAHRRDRHRRARARDARAPRAGVSGRHRHAAARDRPLCMAAGRGAPPVESRDDRAASGRGAERELRDVRGVLPDRQRGCRASADRCAGCCVSASLPAGVSRSTRSSRRARS